MQLEFHQLQLRYERLKVVRPEPERRLLASLAEVGQQVPIVVVEEAAESTFVVIDGYKRVRALRRLGRDIVGASCWPGEEAEALIVTRLMQTAEPETALEQSWLLAELRERFAFSLEELARRFGHSVSWVSRRLALVRELPEEIQERVRRGEIGAHGAAKYLDLIAIIHPPSQFPSVRSTTVLSHGAVCASILFRSPSHRRTLHPILVKLGQPKCGAHAFRRFRNTYLKNRTSCPEGVRQFWLGWEERDMSDLYDKIREDAAFRSEWAEKSGLGFEIPSKNFAEKRRTGRKLTETPDVHFVATV